MPHKVKQFIAPIITDRLYKQLDSWEQVRKFCKTSITSRSPLFTSHLLGTFGLNFQIAKRRSMSSAFVPFYQFSSELIYCSDLFQLGITPEDLFDPETSPQNWDNINLLQRIQRTRQAKSKLRMGFFCELFILGSSFFFFFLQM